jgi:hypothetical protein
MIAFRNSMCIKGPRERDKRRGIIETAWLGIGGFDEALEARQGAANSDPRATSVAATQKGRPAASNGA